MEWELAKIWHCPIRDVKIQELSFYEKLLYRNLILNDRDEEREKIRSSIEYAMAFLKPEVVRKILESRKNEEEGEEIKEIFEKQVAEMFGKPLQSSG